MNTFCSYYNQGICSSCKKIELPYSDQVEAKLDQLRRLLEPFGPYEMHEPVYSQEKQFRNKAKVIITGTLEDPLIGLAGENDLDQGRDIKNCPLHTPEINQVLAALPEFIRLAKIPPYQIKNKKGELKGAILYYSPASDSMYLRLVLRSKEGIDRIKKHASVLLERFPFIHCLSINIQPVAHAILEGKEEIYITEKQSIPHQLGDIAMSLHPQGFVQTNQDVALKLYETAATWVKGIHPQSFMELFSGQGAFSFFIQEHVQEAIGVEINPEGVQRANDTAKELKLKHLRFLASDASNVEEVMTKLDPDVLLVNPPRRGLGRALEVVQKFQGTHFIYSSCDAETLAEDLLKLKDRFEVKRVCLFDMFPHTDHFETLVLLKAIKADRNP